MANDKQKTGQGLITEVSGVKIHGEGDSERPYKIVNLGKRKFSCWKSELFDELVEGASIDFKYTTSKDGKYHNIESVKSDGNGSGAGGDGQLTKDQLIVRQSSLGTASNVVNTLENDYKKVTEVILVMAERFEEWVWRKKTSEPPPPEED